ncbi:MAG: NAD(P)-dependent oxidoreductase [Desulfovibrio sp.]|nr:NAD(P)-dependent oxidoreductase [Desulfovibrio sp.]
MKIVVSGGTGFVGGHLLPLLHDAGCEITCLVRSSSDTSRLPKGARVTPCDLMSGEGLSSALKGHDVFIHMAALLFGLSWDSYLTANAAAAQQLCQAMDALGKDAPKKMILVSSMAATGPSRDPAPDDIEPHPVSAYGWSKLLVERTFEARYSGTLVTLRPSIIYGSGDRGLLPVFKGAKKGFALSPGWNRNFYVSCIHGRDMARAIMAALDEKARGVYHVSDGKTYTMDSFNRAMCTAFGYDSPRIFHIPLPLMALSAELVTLAARLYSGLCSALTGNRPNRAPNWNTDKYREAATEGFVCSAKRLREELGFTPLLSLEEGMRETVAGYQERGWL